MAKIGRNTPCPCGSGEKYKRCCERKEAELRASALPPGRFRYEAGSYGGPGRGYMPSILGYKEIGPDSWTEHLCLVKLGALSADEDEASSIAEADIATARQAQIDGGGNPAEFAMSLRYAGYKNVPDFRKVKTGS